ncbi:MAG: FMN-binding protein [Planctomycetota bacterium]
MKSSNVARRPLTARFIHALRIGLVLGLFALIPDPVQREFDDQPTAPDWDAIGDLFPADANRFDEKPDDMGLWGIYDAGGNLIAKAARTLPAAKDVSGYRGPTEAVAWMKTDPSSDDLIIQGVALLGSADTAEHVDAVRSDAEFFDQMKGWSWQNPPDGTDIDGVSGATLTSLALVEGLLRRMDGRRSSLLFAESIRAKEILDWFPQFDRLEVSGSTAIVSDAKGNVLGTVVRTGPLSDDVIGYQGASELLIRLDPNGRVSDVRLRSSFDNLPYTDYVRDESAFWDVFRGKTMQELAEMDLDEQGVEGVSGATMSSLAVADTVVRAASERLIEEQLAKQRSRPWWKEVRYGASDVAMFLLILATAWFGGLGWFGRRWMRTAWLILVILTIGLWTGNLISMSLLTGWASGGVGWRLAPGLTAIVAVAVIMPPLRKSNPYCSHLCPHGAIQQLIRPGSRSRRKWNVGRRAAAWLRWIPGITLVVAYVALLWMPSVDLSAWEPFHAYLFRIAGWGSFVFAAVSVGASAVVPMAYCRFGCPTGSLLDYLRRTARSDRIGLADAAVGGLMILAIWMQRG